MRGIEKGSHSVDDENVLLSKQVRYTQYIYITC